jgi:hypothetical protein
MIGALGVAAMAALVVAAAPYSKTRSLRGTSDRYDILDAQDASDTDADNRTVTQNVDGFSRLIVRLKLTDANSSVSALVVTCTGSIDDGSTYGSVTSRSISAGTGTVSVYTDEIAPSGTATYTLVYDVWGFDKYRCVYAATGATSADLFDVQWKLAVGQ